MNLHKRIPLYSVGLLLTSLGIVLITKADIGIAPVSTLPYALSLVIPQITLGTFMTFMHLTCMLAQLAILRRMTPALVMQIPVAYVFGLLVDMYNAWITVAPPNYFSRLLLLLGGILCLAFGISFSAGANFTMAPPDALCFTISVLTGRTLGWIKRIFDTGLAIVAGAVAGILLGSPFRVVGVGTIACMLLTGTGVGLVQKLMPFLDMSRKPAEPVQAEEAAVGVFPPEK